MKYAAAAPVAAAMPANVGAAPLTRRRVRPTDPAWPSAARWEALKEAVGGHLIQPQPLYGACGTAPAGEACLATRENIGNPFWLGDQAGGSQISGWLDAWAPAPSAYAVAATSAAEVAAAVNFARVNRLRLVVKGAGHSYQGTSNGADSLLVWTRAMNRVAVRDDFIPAGCVDRLAPVPAVTAEAGATWIDLYHAVTGGAGRYVQGGGCADVGVAGLVQSGGFGSFSKGFGTAAAGLLEAEVVTADGSVLTVNPCSHPDLFWALKGGGGGSFGVITRLTLATHPLPEDFGVAWGTIKARSDDTFGALLARFIPFSADNLLNPHWGEQVHVGSDNSLTFSMVSQGVDTQQSQTTWAPFYDWVKASPGDYTVKGLGAFAFPARTFWNLQGNPSMTADRRPGAPPWHGWWKGDQDQVGAFFHGYDSVWLPASLLRQDGGRGLAEALFAASRHKTVGLHLNKGLAGASADAIAATLQTATNPQVTGAFALAIIADGELPAFPGQPSRTVNLDRARKDAREIDAAAAALRKLVPDAGSYVSESNYFNARWRRDFWGVNYPRLRAIKAKYDSDGLFSFITASAAKTGARTGSPGSVDVDSPLKDHGRRDRSAIRSGLGGSV